MSHPRELVFVVRDPEVEAGPFRVYLRTDGKFVVVDRRLWGTPRWASAAVEVLDLLPVAARRAGELEQERRAGGGAEWSL